jgi:uncharacterized membrane protein
MKKQWVFIVLIILLVALPEFSEAQCAMCKAAVESSQGQKNSVAAGINKGILYLMAIPYLLLLFIFRKQIYVLWKKFRGKEVVSSED